MSNPTIKATQQMLLGLGYNPKGVDGLWGRNSEAAFQALVKDRGDSNYVSWGSKLTVEEIKAVKDMITSLNMKVTVNDLMACIAFETGGTFSPSIRNPSSSGTGVIQFMESTAVAYGTTTAALAKMTFTQQLKYVAMHFKPYANKIKDMSGLYMSILWPRAIDKPDSYALWTLGDRAYMYNNGLDINKDGRVTRLEASHYIKNRYVQGFTSEYVRILQKDISQCTN